MTDPLTTHWRALVVGALLVGLAGCVGAPGELDTSIDFQERTETVGLDYETGGGGPGNGNDGVYVADYDRDGWQDVLAIGGERPMLFANTGGEFARVETFPTVEGDVKGGLFFDADGDGWEDLLLLRSYGEPLLLENDAGTFERSGNDFGNLTYPIGATVADYDRDGDTDLLIYQTGDWAETKPEGYYSLNQTLEEDNGFANVLYENTDDGFERVADSGLGEATRWSLAASFVDLNGDGHQDVHVANDYNTDVVYINDGDGTFEERTLRGNTSRNGMSSEIADVDGDGSQDVFTTNIYLPLQEVTDPERHERLDLLFGNVLKSGRTKGNTLMMNDGTGTFNDSAVAYGVREGGWGWASSLVDLDNDGDRDLVHATQYVVQIDPADPHYTYPMLFERVNDSRFQNRDASAYNLTEHDGRGLATLDYDRDGDRDVIVAPYDGEVTVYENTGAAANSIAFRAVDDAGSTAYGAEIVVSGPSETVVQQTVESDFLSQESRLAHVGLAGATSIDLAVTWPDGTERTFEDVSANQQVRLTKDGLETVVEYEADD